MSMSNQKTDVKVTPKKQASKKDKRGYVFFCRNFCGFQYETSDGRCPVCKEKVVRESTNESAAKRFEIILLENEKAFAHIMFLTPNHDQLKFPFPIGKQTYFVPVKWFAEYLNLEHSDKEGKPLHIQLEAFFEAIKKSCKSYKF